MIYTKTTTNGIQMDTPVSELPLFCKCPVCSKELRMTPYEVQELIQEGNFDIDESAMYCDDCHEEANLLREQIRNMINAVDNMTLDKLKQLGSFLLPYCTGEDNV